MGVLTNYSIVLNTKNPHNNNVMSIIGTIVINAPCFIRKT